MVVFYFFCKPVCYALPAPHRQLLLPLCPDFPTSPRRWAIILPSLLLGAWSHNFWDAFTHEHGWFVERIPWLMQPVVQLSTINVRVYLVLQEVSTVVGFLSWRLLTGSGYAASRRRRPITLNLKFGATSFGAPLPSASFLFGYPAAAAYANSVSAHGFLFLRSILFRTAVYAPQVAVPLSLIAAAIIYAQRQRSSEGPTPP